MKVVVTGAAGFIGSNIVKALNDRGVSDVVAVDDLTQADKFHNRARTVFLGKRLRKRERRGAHRAPPGIGSVWEM